MKDFNLLNIALLATLGFGCVLCVGIVKIASAEEAPLGTPAVERARDNAEVRTEAREMRRESLETQVQDRVINLTMNVTTRFVASLDRMSNIADRIESRINKLSEQGIDTAPAKARLAEAKKTIADGRTKLASVPSVTDAIRSEKPRESFANVRAELISVRDTILQSHSLLLETIFILKESVRTNELSKGVSTDTATSPTE